MSGVKMLLPFAVLQFISLATLVSADYMCTCNEATVMPVYPMIDTSVSPLGFLTQNECKPSYKNSTLSWLAIQFNNKVGFIQRSEHTIVMVCPGTPNSTDKVEETHFMNCYWVANHNCTGYTGTKECGSDGVTYDNRCLFAKARCQNLKLHIMNDGNCVTSTPSTPHIQGNQAVFDFFCAVLSHRPCDKDDVSPVCAIDGITYANFCEYDKTRCTHRQLHVAHFGPCI